MFSIILAQTLCFVTWINQHNPVPASQRLTVTQCWSVPLGRKVIEVLTTQDSCDFSLADMQDIHPIKGHCVQLLVAGSHLIKGVNIFIAFLLSVPSTPNS